ncbi:MAG: hypothetical protein R3298_01535 [Gammaproteobacteria bacterium]|nr:hypothetical protein [Gammaproteobacteria bacterium]
MRRIFSLTIPLVLTLLLVGCLGQGDTIVEYRLRCIDDRAESLASCNAWDPAPRTFYELDTDNDAVTRRVEDGGTDRYDNCTIHNTDHWSCAAEIGLPAIEFKQGRRIQGEEDRLLMQLSKRVTWFEWWAARLQEMVFG